MPYLVSWTEGAMEDLMRHYTFMAEQDAQAALQVLTAIEQGTTLLENFPSAGRPAEDLEPEQKELLIPFGAAGYVLLYEVIGGVVVILALRHQKEVGY